ncbi:MULTISPECIES: NUDIX domain-containing protein [unclassified Bacillus (in: firmicutes)]|uniref:NUDIX domain-containing protein n=1 Tax=unclassified Bacillus (in: firmicutes) TaxID=185979 RepID=UPI0008E17D62|nr:MULTISPECIES: NUDIX hydrolase [unclassified Bacillus (in: firmicutes)]SFB12838.1 NUDIX domain-containing protein [Bacillus sp. UNCCL13]SFQ90179.1 NUDIX domain-containing protein [Bacillus sp. cl95]
MGTTHKRGHVWLAVSGLVKDKDGNWLVVKKRYGGLKGQWSLPAGFVEAGETADEAIIREVREETGIQCKVEGLIGLRTGVLNEEISDNMLIFSLIPSEKQNISHQVAELFEAQFMSPEKLKAEKNTSILLHYIMGLNSSIKPGKDDLNPGDHFGYTTYKVFL